VSEVALLSRKDRGSVVPRSLLSSGYYSDRAPVITESCCDDASDDLSDCSYSKLTITSSITYVYVNDTGSILHILTRLDFLTSLNRHHQSRHCKSFCLIPANPPPTVPTSTNPRTTMIVPLHFLHHNLLSSSSTDLGRLGKGEARRRVRMYFDVEVNGGYRRDMRGSKLRVSGVLSGTATTARSASRLEYGKRGDIQVWDLQCSCQSAMFLPNLRPPMSLHLK